MEDGMSGWEHWWFGSRHLSGGRAKGLKLFDDENDTGPVGHAEFIKSKGQLLQHYQEQYMWDSPALVPSWPAVMSTSTFSISPQKADFTTHYKQQLRPMTNELMDYFKLSQEYFDACNPLAWWAGCQSQFPNLSQFAHDLLSMPGELSLIILSVKCNILMISSLLLGSVVAVEWIFSGGCNTISLHRVSLKPETICTLMLVKQHLHLAWEAVKEIIGC